MKKIVFGITSLTLGGAERVLVDIANELSSNYDITIFTIYSNGELEKELNKDVKLESIYNCSYLSLSKIKKKIIPLKILLGKNKIYKKYIKGKYNCEIAFLEGAITRIFSCGKEENKKIAWIHNDISKVFGNDLKSNIKKSIDRKIYERYNKLIFVSNDNKEIFEKQYKINNEKQVIYNYINSNKVLEKSNKEIEIKFNKDELNIVTVARLVEQKAIDRLIKVHSKLVKEGLKHNIYVIGDGPLKNSLEELIKKENVESTFKLFGAKVNPYPYIKNADIFCLLSNFEGYPMVLEEAKILNKTILITDTAAREVVKDYEKGQVIDNDENAIYSALKEIIENGKYKIQENLDKHIEYDNKQILESIVNLIES